MPDVELGSVPFQEAIDHFRGKLDIPSSSWDEMRGQVHAKGFTVAGATKADLLKDLRSEVDSVLSQGGTISDFRKGFDQAVKKHGWSYRGERGWRTRVIYDTNLRTARMAGRWQQIQRVKQHRPYLEYQTVGDTRVRPEHAAWDGTILPVDHPWFSTHYPPNGWGCRCTVRSLTRRDVERSGREVSQAPEVQTTERINASTGEVYGEVPTGIDVGWDYNVGQAWLGPDIALGEKIMGLSTSMRRRALQDAQQLVPRISQEYQPWAARAVRRKRTQGETRTAGYLPPDVSEALERRGQRPSTAVVTVGDREIIHMVREVEESSAIPTATLRRLPASLQDATAVLWDREDPSLVYVLAGDPEERRRKIFVRVDFATQAVQTNAVRTGGLVDLDHLRADRYEAIQGEL